MVKRTFRQPHDGVISNTNSDAGTNGSAEDSAHSSDAAIDGTDNTVVWDGKDTERDTERTGSSVRIVEIDPESIDDYIASGGSGNGDSTGDEPRKRRKRGPNKRTTGAKKAQDSVEPFILMAHTWAAAFLKTPELQLEKEEAKQISDAYIEFCQYHDVPMLSPKRLSEINLIAALGLVYVPRVIAIRNRTKEERRAANAKKVQVIQ
jgi:hypothetical protein